jgi:hypothetical protein
LLEFKTIECKRKGYAIATDEQLARIAKVPNRELMRRRINQHTFGENLLATSRSRNQAGNVDESVGRYESFFARVSCVQWWECDF